MMATVEQVQFEWRRLIDLAQKGEEISITSQGRVIAKLTGVAVTPGMPAPDRRAWLAELAELREKTSSGKGGPSAEEILEDLRSERI
jgi:antitoxin (DNA-binding transcriptional repressor) of toxin-antitoxin stability system